jgi:hypothetical protein
MDLPDGNGKPNLVRVATDQLRQRLNRLYTIVRTQKTNQSLGRFDYLWDLKELAVLEGKPAVEIPDTWLDELELVCADSSSTGSRGH